MGCLIANWNDINGTYCRLQPAALGGRAIIFNPAGRRINMLGIMLLAIGAGGFGLAAYLDLKTTEFPDWLPYSMIVLALAVRGGYALYLNDFSIITQSIMTGLLFLGLGLLLYFTKQWGDGDAWLLGALGFLFPDAAGFSPAMVLPFPAAMMVNFFLVSFLYIVAYAVIIGIRGRNVRAKFYKELKGNSRVILSTLAALIAIYLSFVYFLAAYYGVSIPLEYNIGFPALMALIVLFMRYGKFVESNLFRKRVPVSRLRPGDVLAKNRWKGLTEDDIKALKEKGGHVWIKEGVRFAPVFLITLLVTLFYGSVMVFLV